jgi:hypothetical protein
MASAASSGSATATAPPAVLHHPPSPPALPVEVGDVDSDEDMEDSPQAHVDETSSIAATQPTAPLNSNEKQSSIVCAPQTAADVAAAGSASFTSASAPVATLSCLAPSSQSTVLSSSFGAEEPSASNAPSSFGTSSANNPSISIDAVAFREMVDQCSSMKRMLMEMQAEIAVLKGSKGAVPNAQTSGAEGQ